jgi:hypothetical protein
MKTQHQYPEFGHKEGEIQKKKPAKKYTSIQEWRAEGGGEAWNSENDQVWG